MKAIRIKFKYEEKQYSLGAHLDDTFEELLDHKVNENVQLDFYNDAFDLTFYTDGLVFEAYITIGDKPNLSHVEIFGEDCPDKLLGEIDEFTFTCK